MQPTRTASHLATGQQSAKPPPTNKGPCLASGPPQHTREGDPHWLRVMETKENQWRFLHTLALHEMSTREREACSQLDSLSERLDELLTACDRTDRVVRRCRAHRFRQHVARVATKPVQQAAAYLSAARYISVANDLAIAENAIPVRTNATSVVEEITRFRKQAELFRRSAADVGIVQLISLAEVLEKLASTVATEAAIVVDTATEVTQVARTAELARSKLLSDITQQQVSTDTKS